MNCRSAWVRFNSIILALTTYKGQYHYTFQTGIRKLLTLMYCNIGTQWWCIGIVLLFLPSLAAWCYWAPLQQTSGFQTSLKTQNIYFQNYKPMEYSWHYSTDQRVQSQSFKDWKRSFWLYAIIDVIGIEGKFRLTEHLQKSRRGKNIYMCVIWNTLHLLMSCFPSAL